MNKKLFISIIAVIANLFLAIGKLIVGTIAKSGAIFADGINSATDVVASIISFIGIKVAEKPADKKHPYGHGKAEVISGFVITLIIFASGIFIILTAIQKILNPAQIEITTIAFTIMAISAATNGIMSYLKVHFGKKYDSVSLVSDGIHSRIDLLVSLAIFIGLFLTKFSLLVDPVLAFLVGAYILKESFHLGKETTDSLLGASAGPEIETQIKQIIKLEKLTTTELKTQKKGSQITVNIKLKLPSKTKVEQATAISNKLRKKLMEKMPSIIYVSIQVESHNLQENYYQPSSREFSLGQGFSWRRQGKFKKENKQAKGIGPGGYCICPKGDYKVKHQRGTPCSELKCPHHNINLTREQDA